jgi:myo-inositol 2-dehydrogenase/D-chiro-inositol 1-dehydrogenase
MYRDKTIHCFDLVRFVTGMEVVEVYAMGDTHADMYIADLGDVDTCVVQLRLSDNSFCQIDNTRRASYGFDERIEVFGTLGVRQAGPNLFGSMKADNAPILGVSMPQSFMERFERAFAHAIDGFARFVLDEDRGVPMIEDGLAAQVIAEAATKSASERRPVKIASIPMDSLNTSTLLG